MVGALINLTSLVMIGVYLLYEAAMRFVESTQIDGRVMIVVATVALAVDLGTVVRMRTMGRGLNIRAALAHNFADALASLAVIVAGTAILLWDLNWMDPALTALIAIYILIQSLAMLRESIAILMDSVPDSCAPEQVAAAINEVVGVHGVHHLHLRRLDEHYLLLEAHVVVDHADATTLADCKQQIRTLLHERFEIEHTTLDFEFTGLDRDHSDRLIAAGH